MQLSKKKESNPESMFRAEMSLLKGVKTKAKVGTQLSEQFEVNVGVYQEFPSPSQFFAS